jgi:hypothetical protein
MSIAAGILVALAFALGAWLAMSGPRWQVFRDGALTVLFSVLSMFSEKDPVKLAGLNLPFVFSWARIGQALITLASFRLIWQAENLGWPDAWLGIACVLAPPLLNALSKVKPEVALEFGKSFFSRAGVGSIRATDTPSDRETLVERRDDGEPEDKTLSVTVKT